MRAGRIATALIAAVAIVGGAGAAPAGARAAVDALQAIPACGGEQRDLSAEQARVIGLREPALATALRLRPAADVRVSSALGSSRWQVLIRDRGTGIVLASIELDRGTGCTVAATLVATTLGDYPPRSSERQVIDAAIADPQVRRAAREWGGAKQLRARARVDGCCWEVDLLAPHRTDGAPTDPVIRVDVVDASRSVTGVWTGIQIPWRMARGDRAAFGGDVSMLAIWLPLFALFALVTIDWLRLRSWANADVVAVLALGVSHEAFQQGRIDWSVPLAVAPLLWIAGRMGWIFLRGLPAPSAPHEPRSRLGRLATRRVPTMLIVVLCVAMAGLRIGITVDGGNVIDVGYAGVAGARLELRGEAPWGNMPADVRRGDTYGPANYLAYVPATALLDDVDRDTWGRPLPAAQATSIAADLGCMLLLALIGWRWISRRGAVLLAAGWLTCPWTTWALASGVNDALVALALLAAFALVPRPVLRGAAIGVAAMVKIAPLVVLAPLLHAGSRARARQAISTSVGCAVVIAAGLAWAVWRIGGSPVDAARTFVDRTVAFQLGRDSPFSPWGLYGWDVAQHVAQVVVVVLLVAACWRPRARDAWQTAAGAAAALAAVQLVATHWFYLYVPWFIGFVLIVLVATRERPSVCSAAWTSPLEPRSSPPTGPGWEPSSPSSNPPASTTSTGM